MSNSRYDRQKRLAILGTNGQDRIEAATVAIVGCGALGSVVAGLLARAGVGRLLLIDRDIVQWPNLQRQVLYDEQDAKRGRAKAEAAARHLRRVNSEVVIEPYVVDVVPANVIGLLSGADLWIDGTDNFEVRFLMNEAALHLKKPWVHGGCVATHGQVMLFWPELTCCFQCLVPFTPARGSSETCDTVGVLGPATSAIASLQSSIALRAIVDGDGCVDGKLYSLDLWPMTFRTMATEKLKAQGCAACRSGIFSHLHGKGNPEPQVLCGQNAIQFPANSSINLDMLSQSIQGIGKVQRSRFFVRCELKDERITVFKDGRVVVEGTQDLARAKSLIHQMLGG